MMKYYSMLIFLILNFFGHGLNAQKYFVELYGAPAIYNFSSIVESEEGLGYNDYSVSTPLTYEFGTNIMTRITDKFRVGIGLSLKNYRYKIDYALHDPLSKDVFYNAHRETSIHSYGIRIVGALEFKKSLFELVLELNQPFSSEVSDETISGQILFFFDFKNLVGYSYSIDEFNEVSDSPYRYFIPQLKYGYRLTNNLFLTAQIGIKPSGDHYFHFLRITGSAPEYGTEETVQLNYSYARNRFLTFGIGANYIFRI